MSFAEVFYAKLRRRAMRWISWVHIPQDYGHLYPNARTVIGLNVGKRAWRITIIHGRRL